MSLCRKPVIAIDGTFASGKGTLARRLAEHFGFAYLDTGKLYRAVARRALQAGTELDNAQALADLARQITPEELDNVELKSGPVGAAASKVAILPDVRAALFQFQRDFAMHPGKGYKGAVLDGRDIGTVICPEADVKLYVDASPDVRARRRYLELRSYGENVSLAQVAADLAERDNRDKSRPLAPLKIAENAHLLDTTNLSIDAAFEQAKALVLAVLKQE
ncbi:MAG TPA: (d)CMP kinase [Hellea balneolensis]|uniref:Cytidylate kinase n=1 Tax=Hellea balneolensis TaxID=287478 RepID=A0A7V5U1C9_9PROT|nr:(d)CMP kinase [Hellea balneolensis]